MTINSVFVDQLWARTDTAVYLSQNYQQEVSLYSESIAYLDLSRLQLLWNVVVFGVFTVAFGFLLVLEFKVLAH